MLLGVSGDALGMSSGPTALYRVSYSPARGSARRTLPLRRALIACACRLVAVLEVKSSRWFDFCSCFVTCVDPLACLHASGVLTAETLTYPHSESDDLIANPRHSSAVSTGLACAYRLLFPLPPYIDPIHAGAFLAG